MPIVLYLLFINFPPTLEKDVTSPAQTLQGGGRGKGGNIVFLVETPVKLLENLPV
jgi:hypothetical protein